MILLPRSHRPVFLAILASLLLMSCGQKPKHLDEALSGQPAGTYAYYQTTQGDFLARLFTGQAPETTATFIGLAEGTREWLDPRSRQWVSRPFYDGLLFFHVIDNEFILTGDPLNLGIGGPGFTIQGEPDSGLLHDRAGLLTMVTVGGDDSTSMGSQFMITLAPQPNLNGRFSVFGEVVWGSETVTRIAKIPTHMDNRPVRDVKIRHVSIHRINGAEAPPSADDGITTSTSAASVADEDRLTTR